jgi:propanol-preferring alcohol dehydrogenase
VNETQARPGDWVVISGIGGLGHLGVQYTKAIGLQVCAVDINDQKLEHAKQLGADAVVNAKNGDSVAAVVANCINIRGSFVGSRRDMAEALAFAADGKVKADIEIQPLSAINKVFARQGKGEVPSRVVLDFTATPI